MNEKYQLNLSFKGERNYIHGPDFYNLVSDLSKQVFSQNAWVSRIIFRDFAKGSCYVRFGSKDAGELVLAKFTVEYEGRSLSGVIIDEGNRVAGRYPYDEASVYKCSHIEGKRIYQESRVGYSAIEEIVALTKKLHLQVHPTSGRWVFTQLDLSEEFPENTPFSIEIKKDIKQRMTRSEIFVNKTKLGTITFSVAE